jgi:hypothetical protein
LRQAELQWSSSNILGISPHQCAVQAYPHQCAVLTASEGCGCRGVSSGGHCRSLRVGQVDSGPMGIHSVSQGGVGLFTRLGVLGSLPSELGQGWPAHITYLWARGSWKTSCHTEKSPLRWSLRPTRVVCTSRTLSSRRPLPYKNWTQSSGVRGSPHPTSPHPGHLPTCRVLMQARMSLSVFSQRAASAPGSDRMPCRREI